MAFDRQIAALTLFVEASGTSTEERRAVCHVLFNRLNDPKRRFGTTLAEVCLMRFQFSPWLDDKGDNANLRRGARASDDDPIVQECLALYDTVAAGSDPDPTRGACHYIDRSIPNPGWAQQAAVSLETTSFRFFTGVT